MKKTLLAASLAALIAAPALAETKSYDLPAFTGLHVATGIQVEFSVGSPQSVIAENQNGAWDKLDVKVEDGELHLQRKSKGWGSKKETFKVTVSAPSLNSVETSSGASVMGSGVSGDEVEIESASGSTVKISDISAGELEVDTSSGSTVILSGTCTSVSIDTSSGSSLNAEDLVCQSAEVETSSGSSVSITAAQSLEADSSSGSSVNVYGSPATTQIEKSSGASVNIRG